MDESEEVKCNAFICQMRHDVDGVGWVGVRGVVFNFVDHEVLGGVTTVTVTKDQRTKLVEAGFTFRGDGSISAEITAIDESDAMFPRPRRIHLPKWETLADLVSEIALEVAERGIEGREI